MDAKSAASELLRRSKIRNSLADWARACGFEPAAHHLLIIEKLEAVALGHIKRLMILLPPGSAKSTYASALFPPWFLNRSPGLSILSCSHSADLAESFGRRCRNLIEEHENKLGYGLSAHSQAAGRWETTHGCGYVSAGVGGRIAGRRADLALIDDPVGSREDADSKLVRDKQWEWYNFDLKTRLKPDAAVVLIQTRWHEDDLAGRILESDSESWDIIKIPFIAEKNDPVGRAVGERLWTGYYTDEMEREARSDSRAFSALYQQAPAPDSGDFFKKEWLLSYTLDEIKDKELRIYVASDHAVSLRENADRTCLLPVGVDNQDNIYVLPDFRWKQMATDETVTEMLAMIQRRKPLVWWAEKGHISSSIGPFLTKRMNEERTWCFVDEVQPARDKQTRAQSIRGRMSMGKVRFPTFSNDWPAIMHELLTFPAGKHDDFVDALAHVGMGLDKVISPAKHVNEVTPSLDEKWKPTFAWLKKSDERLKRVAAAKMLDY